MNKVSNSKAKNQYYGKFLECCIVAAMNNSEEVEYEEDYIFSEDEQSEFFEEAEQIANYLGKSTAIYIGNKTSNEKGDIYLPNTNEHVEIKRVSSGTGTYYNTSIYYLSKFGFNFHEYMEKFGLIKTLKENFINFVSVSEQNNSPVTQKESHYIRNDVNTSKLYKEIICPLDKKMREAFTNDVYHFFINHPDKAYDFFSDMLNKESLTNKKGKPDKLLIYNYNKKTITELNVDDFFKSINKHIKKNNLGLAVGNIRIAFSWQNGAGLNNPTIRVFLQE